MLYFHKMFTLNKTINPLLCSLTAVWAAHSQTQWKLWEAVHHQPLHCFTSHPPDCSCPNEASIPTTAPRCTWNACRQAQSEVLISLDFSTMVTPSLNPLSWSPHTKFPWLPASLQPSYEASSGGCSLKAAPPSSLPVHLPFPSFICSRGSFQMLGLLQ